MMNMDFEKKLTIPMDVKKMYPVSQKNAEIVGARDKELKSAFCGESKKFILIIGPCSADNEDSILDYVYRLRKIEEKVKDKIIIVPRIYTNKPRTSGDGYMGMLHQPNPSEKPDLLKGIITVREMLMRILSETEFSCADELLYPENHKYFDDLLGYVAVGARSVEDQQHRLTASGVDIPVGMKNPTSGDTEVLLNAISSAQQGHTFIYRGWQAHSKGNPYAHAILRGYVNRHGEAQPNYHYEDLIRFYEAYAKRDLQNMALIVDTNHSNSNKNPLEQIRIAKEVMQTRHQNRELESFVKGLMIESYIEDGAQKIGEGHYGTSITDACLGWEKSERLIFDIADSL